MDCSIALALMLRGAAPADLVAPACPAAIVRVAEGQPVEGQPAEDSPNRPATDPISHEPLYAGLVQDANALRAETQDFSKAPSLALRDAPRFQTYLQRLQNLSAGDLKGHFDLKKRGTDRDLKCILLGVSRDLTNKVNDLKSAASDAALARALGDTDLLLRDNIDVIVTPDTVDSGLDCTVEFGKDA